MSFIDDGKTTVAKHWYIRHGARDMLSTNYSNG